MADKLITFVFMVLMTIKHLLLTDNIKRYLPLTNIFGLHKVSSPIKKFILNLFFQRSASLKEAIFRINFAVKNLKTIHEGNITHKPSFIFECKIFAELSSIAR